MEYNITERPNCRREISIRFPASEITPKLENEYQNTQKKLQLPGFRKGKVPMNLIKKMFKKQIESSIIGEAVNQAMQEITTKDNLNPIAQPILDEYHYDETDGLSVKLIIDLEPQIELKDYKHIEIEKRIEKITEVEINATLTNLREEHAMLINVEGGAKPEHIVVADLQELDASGVPIIGRRIENQSIPLPAEATNEITQQLAGITAGEVRRVRIGSREQAPETGTENKDRFWEVTAKEIQEKQLPKLDDEFAKDVGNYASLDELKAIIKDQLEHTAENNSTQNLNYRLSEEVIKRNPFDVPELLISNYLNLMVKQIASREKGKKLDEAELRNNYRPAAIRNLKWRMLRDKIVEAENIVVTDAEIEDYLKLLDEQGGRYQEMASLYRRNSEELENLKLDFIENKVLDFLKQSAKITETVIDRNEKNRIIV